jgi:hypothetical protein
MYTLGICHELGAHECPVLLIYIRNLYILVLYTNIYLYILGLCHELGAHECHVQEDFRKQLRALQRRRRLRGGTQFVRNLLALLVQKSTNTDAEGAARGYRTPMAQCALTFTCMQFSCCTSTKVQMLTQKALLGAGTPRRHSAR